MTRQAVKKICVPRLVETLHATIDVDGEHFLDNVDVCGVTLKSAFAGLNLYYVLGLLNSRLLAWYFPLVSASFRGGYRSANRQFLSQLPIRVIAPGAKADLKRQERIINLVGAMLDVRQKANGALSDKDRRFFESNAASLDRQIDSLVYQLYELTHSAIATIEDAAQAVEE